jgi:zinc transport system substrate-binding protein
MNASRRILTVLLVLAGLSLIPGMIPRAAESTKTNVFVTILPLSYFAERIGGNHVQVSVLVPPGQSPATYEPTPGQMVRLADARVLFTIGVPFEKSFLESLAATHKDLKIVDTREGIDLLPMEDDSHDEDGHGHGTHDPHIWLDPVRAKTIAANIAGALERGDPAHAAAYRENLQSLLSDLDELNGRLSGVLAPLKGSALYTFHPAYGYFADRYGLRQKSVSAGGKEPGPRGLATLIDQARRDGARVIFVQPQFSDSTAKIIAREVGAAVVPMDPLAPDYIRNLDGMARKIREALTGE